MVEVDSVLVRRIDRRHDRLVEHVGIEMNPETLQLRPGHVGEGFLGALLRPSRADCVGLEGRNARVVERGDIEQAVVLCVILHAEGSYVLFPHIRLESVEACQGVRPVAGGKSEIQPGSAVTPTPFRIARI